MSDGTGEGRTRARGRRAAEPASATAKQLDALAARLAPALAATVGWVSAHRAVALTGAAALLSVGIIAGGAAVIQAGTGAPDTEASSETVTPRPTPADPAGAQAIPPVLPTATPAPPDPTPGPAEPGDEPVVDEPVVEEPVTDDPVVEPEPETEPDDHPGRGQGPRKPKG